MTAADLLSVPTVRRTVSNWLMAQKRWPESQDPSADHVRQVLGSMRGSFWADKYVSGVLALDELEAVEEYRLRLLDGQAV